MENTIKWLQLSVAYLHDTRRSLGQQGMVHLRHLENFHKNSSEASQARAELQYRNNNFSH